VRRDPIYTALLNKFSTLNNLTAAETQEIPADPYKIYVLWADRFVSNTSVKNALTNVALTQIMSGTPSTGEYLVSNGVYTFAAADVGVNVIITYTYTGILTSWMSLTHWDDVSPDEMPALFLVPKTETNDMKKGMPTKWSIDLDLYLYVNAPQNPTLSPSKLMNPLLDELESMLSIDSFADNVCTLGGLVSHAWIAGQVLRGEGRISTTEIAIVPINILVPA